MSIESQLKKDGIEVTEKLNTLTINTIAKNIARKLCSNFPEFNLNERDLFIKLSRINMYRAKVPYGMSEANYFYKNSSIYFNELISDEDLEEFAIHECIHYLQEIKDDKNNLLKLGQCDFTNFKVYGMGLNEAAVQLMTSKILNLPNESVKYYGIEFSTTSPSYYPVECALVAQMAFITGTSILYESTLFSTDLFKNEFINLTSRKTFNAIQEAIDTILYAEENIIKLNNKLQEIDNRNKKTDNIIKKIGIEKKKISLTFMRTQNLIISSYFDNAFNKIYSLEKLENYRKKLNNFKKYLGITEGYVFYNNYYIKKMDQLEERYITLENGDLETALYNIAKKENKFITLLKAIKNLFSKSAINDEYDYIQNKK